MSLVTFGTMTADVDAVLFDKDGTLFDARVLLREMGRTRLRLLVQAGASSEAVARMCLAIGFDPESGEIDRNGPLACATPREEALAAATALYLAGYPWASARRLALDAYEKSEKELDLSKVALLFPGATAALQSLSAAGVLLGLVTTDGRERSRRMLALAGIDALMSVVVGAEDFSHPKPDPEPLLKACDLLGVSPTRCAYVGDSPNDMLAASNAGVAVRAAVLSGIGDRSSLARAAAVVMESVASIRPFVSQ